MPKDFIGWCSLRSAVERWGKTPLSRKRSHSTLVIILVLVYAQLLSRLGQGTSKIPTACWRIHLKNSPATCGRIGWSDSSADNQNQQPTIQHPSIHQSSLPPPAPVRRLVRHNFSGGGSLLGEGRSALARRAVSSRRSLGEDGSTAKVEGIAALQTDNIQPETKNSPWRWLLCHRRKRLTKSIVAA
jgi:hypothetical protein